MPNKLVKSTIFMALFLTLPLSLFAQGFGSQGPEGEIGDWTIVESSYATIFVDKDIDIRDVSRKIDVDFARYDPIEKELFYDKGISDAERLANKIDIIVRKDKKTLDMHPQGFHINLRIYENNGELWNLYEDIFRERKEHKAFYIHKFRTVYISLSNVSESVLAHEIGHAIIDNYFAILPPQKVRELLACYCDVHLKD